MEQKDWDIRREGRRWTHEKAVQRMYQAPEKIEFAGGIFNNDDERMTVLAMLLENLGIDRVVRLVLQRRLKQASYSSRWSNRRNPIMARLLRDSRQKPVVVILGNPTDWKAAVAALEESK